jgi:methyl-accepting chemotaxis protein
MANDGQIVFEVTADGKHAIADIKEITRAIQTETGKWDTAAKQSTDNMSNHFSSMLKKLVAGFSAVKIGKALLDLGKDAVQAASDLEEVQNVVDVTFGDGAAKIESWSKAAGAQFGLTETQAKRFTSTLGAMAKSAGLSGSQIVDMSTDLAGLAADMASFYNLDFDTAFQKIRSGISGETEPLKQLGINMSVANLNAFALQQGLDKTFEKMTQGEQTMLRYQYIMSATSDAQGDFARTSDGYANSMRKLETNVNAIKTALGQTFLGVVQEAVNGLNGFLELLIPDESKRTVLDDFADIDLKTETKLTEIERVKTEADNLNEILSGIFTATDDNGENTGDVVAKLGVKSEKTAAYLASLGLSTDEIDQKESKWLETCKRLVKVIPGLNEIINTETGEVKGGTQAVKDYIDAWEKGQRKLVMLGALQEKESALSTRFADLPGLELDLALAEKKVRDQRKAIDAILEKYGRKGFNSYDENGHIKFNNPGVGLSDDEKEIYAALEAYNSLVDSLNTARDKYTAQKEALEEAKVAIEEYRAAIEEEYGSIEAATAAGVEWSDEMKEAARTVTEAAKNALQNLSDYVEGVRTATLKSIDSTVKGFEKVETPMMKARQKIADLTDEMGNLDKSSKDYESQLKKINDQINATQTEKISAQGIGANLEQQAKYMEDYLANLQKARELGISDDILAQLSDGSVESYDYLEAMANAAPGEVTKINENFQKVIDKKNQLADELTGQQLTVDEVYKTMQQEAAEAVAALDMGQTAAENAGKTVAGLAQGIADHVPDVQTAVDSILEQLNRLDGWGLSIDLGGFGNINFTTSTGSDASGRFGIGYVPRDDYLIRAHEGERLLTAQENQIWNTLLNGGVAGFDLDDLGGVMRDNIRPGGNVYLDGAQVGRVVSDVQGRSYKSLQRSGWQG